MNLGRDGVDEQSAVAPDAVRWTVRETDEHVQAVADVPGFVPREAIGFGANDSEVAVFVGTPERLQWTVTLPSTVKPTPVSVSYNNGVVELLFARDAPPE